MQKINIITYYFIGLLSLSIQPLLLRDFMTFFQADSFAITCFFSSWLIASAIGAFAGRFIKLHGSILLILFLPLILLSKESFLHIHQFLKITNSTIIPLHHLFMSAFIVNFPINCVIGAVFSSVFFLNKKNQQTTSLVYLFECLGGLTGSLLSASALQFNADHHYFLLIAALISIIPPFLYIAYQKRFFLLLLLIIPYSLTFFVNPQENFKTRTHNHIWQQFFPGQTPEGYFNTSHSVYLYGTHKQKFIVAGNGTIEEQFPDRETAKAPIALHMAQNPEAENILLAGSSLLPMIDEILKYPDVKTLDVTGTDPEYLEAVFNILPEEQNFPAKNKLTIIKKDLRLYLSSLKEKKYGLVIINLPLPSNASFHRFFTVDFFKKVARNMNEDGVFCISMQGNEKYIGKEKVLLAATVLKTIESVFHYSALIPGNIGWLVASNSKTISNDPAILAERAAGISGISEIFPPKNFHDIFSLKTAKDTMKKFRSLRDKIETNSDFNPHLLFISYLVTGKIFTGKETSFLNKIPISLIYYMLISLVYFILLRFFYLLPFPRGKKLNPLEAVLSIYIGGISSLSMYLCIIYMFQTVFASLYLNAGFISALYMAGLFIGGALSNKIITEKKDIKTFIRIILISLSILSVWIAFKLNFNLFSFTAFLTLIFLAGLFHGPIFPSSCRILRSFSFKTKNIAAISWGIDQSGALTGAILSGLILIPLFGPGKTVLIILPFFFFLFILISIPRKTISSSPKNISRKLAYIFFGFIFYLFLLNISGKLINKTETTIITTNKDQTLTFNTHSLTPEIKGYHGHIPLQITINNQGTIKNIEIKDHFETPLFFKNCLPMIDAFTGKNIFNREELSEIDIVSGATYSSKAIKDSIIQSGILLKSRNNNLVNTSSSYSKNYIDLRAVIVIVFIVSAFLLQFYPGKKRRLIFLFAAVLILGFFLKVQMTLSDLLNLISGSLPAAGINIPFLLTVIIPIMIVLFGNFYCRWLCPFGAIQEVAGNIINIKVRLPNYNLLKKVKFFRFTILGLILMIFFITRNRNIIIFDPMIAFFVNTDSYSLILASFITFSSFFYKRLWCMAICPVGAFLNIFNDRPWTKKFQKIPVMCKKQGIKNEEK